MAPEYFMYKADFLEIELFLKGAFERDRVNWERTRLESFIIAKIGGCRDDDAKDFLPFSWDEKEKSEKQDVDWDEVKKLREIAKKMSNGQ